MKEFFDCYTFLINVYDVIFEDNQFLSDSEDSDSDYEKSEDILLQIIKLIKYYILTQVNKPF